MFILTNILISKSAMTYWRDPNIQTTTDCVTSKFVLVLSLIYVYFFCVLLMFRSMNKCAIKSHPKYLQIRKSNQFCLNKHLLCPLNTVLLPPSATYNGRTTVIHTSLHFVLIDLSLWHKYMCINFSTKFLIINLTL